MAEVLTLPWVSKLLDYGILLIIATAFVIFLRANWKNFEPSKDSGSSASPASSFQAPRAGNIADITAAISAAINEYRKTNK